MKKLFLFLLLIGHVYIIAQEEYDNILKEIEPQVEKISASRKFSIAEQKEFCADTTRIELFIQKAIEVMSYPSDRAMANITQHAIYLCDKLLNKYYKKLQNELNNDQKQKLLNAQRNWITFMDKEKELISSLYSNPNCIDTTGRSYLLSSHTIFLAIKKRTIELFSHYMTVKYHSCG